MLRVLIVDDEPLVRMGLKSMLNWDELDYEIIGEAPNGQIGLDLIIKDQPDIVITDIKMPVMDGLEMIRLSHQVDRHPKFIILSSYEEFQLVKQAMKLGAEEYLIKLNLEAENLIDTLAAAREKILAERGKIDDQALFEKNLRKNLNMLRESFFERIINRPSRVQGELLDQAASLGIELDPQLACGLIHLNNRQVLEKYDSNEIGALEASIRNTINEIVNDPFKGYTFSWNPGEFVVIFSCEAGQNQESYRQKAINLGERLIQTLKQYFNISVSIGLSNLWRGYEELHQAYLESCRAVQYSYYSDEHPVFLFDELPENNPIQAKLDIKEFQNSISSAIELHEPGSIRTIFTKIRLILQEPNVTREQAYDLCLQLAYLVNGIAGIAEAELKGIIGYDHSLYEAILVLDTKGEIINWLNGLEERLCRFIDKKDEQKNHRVITKAKKFIAEHYAEELGLNEVADAINISPGYLSTIFRQYAGKCFTDYVTEIRIEQAKKLLRESEFKIYEIAEMLGFQNAYYFSKVFKKTTGMTPSEFSGKHV